MGKVYIHEKHVTMKLKIVRAKVVTNMAPPQRAKLKIVTRTGELVVEGTLATAYVKDGTFTAYYDVLAKYRDLVSQHINEVVDVTLVGEEGE